MCMRFPKQKHVKIHQRQNASAVAQSKRKRRKTPTTSMHLASIRQLSRKTLPGSAPTGNATSAHHRFTKIRWRVTTLLPFCSRVLLFSTEFFLYLKCAERSAATYRDTFELHVNQLILNIPSDANPASGTRGLRTRCIFAQLPSA